MHSLWNHGIARGKLHQLVHRSVSKSSTKTFLAGHQMTRTTLLSRAVTSTGFDAPHRPSQHAIFSTVVDYYDLELEEPPTTRPNAQNNASPRSTQSSLEFNEEAATDTSSLTKGTESIDSDLFDMNEEVFREEVLPPKFPSENDTTNQNQSPMKNPQKDPFKRTNKSQKSPKKASRNPFKSQKESVEAATVKKKPSFHRWSGKKLNEKRSPEMQRRAKRHTRYWKERWAKCDLKSKPTREELLYTIERIVKVHGCNIETMIAAAKQIKHQISVESTDYYDDGKETRSRSKENSMFRGPMTFVIPNMYENPTFERQPEQGYILDLLRNLPQASPDEDQAESDSERQESTLLDLDQMTFQDEDRLLAEYLNAVRRRALFESPLFWGKPSDEEMDKRRQAYLQKSSAERHQEATELAVKIRAVLPKRMYNRTAQLFRKLMLDTDSLSTACKLQEADAAVTENDEAPTNNNFNLPIRRLNCPLYFRSLPYFHLIAPDVFRFLDHDGDSVDEKVKTADDRLYQISLKRWNRQIKQVVDELYEVQERLYQSVERQQQFIKSGSIAATKESDVDYLLNLEKLTQDTQQQIRKKPKLQHIQFDFNTPNDYVIATAPHTMVLVDNLPIDVTQEKLEQWYSRFGKVRSISIKNQRPELDPGQLTKKQASERSIAQRRYKLSYRTRPRTPVYAILDFTDEEGYRKATEPALCVFGLIVGNHDIRSTRIRDRLKSLYIEHLAGETQQTVLCKESPSPELTAIEIERILQDHLDPLLITLASGQDSRGLVSSCQIDFQSFEETWEVYKRLEAEKELQPLFHNIHWIRSPRDALSWWTRERGFEQ